jgi:hypothetical protein
MKGRRRRKKYEEDQKTIKKRDDLWKEVEK